MFRKGAMTLPWGEDYSWQSPIGTQQMSLILLDLFRAGTRFLLCLFTSMLTYLLTLGYLLYLLTY